MVIGLVDAAIAYKNEQWAKQAEIVLQKMTTIFLDDTTIYRVVYNHNKKEGCLEDYAWFIAAMIKMGSIHCSGHYFEKAINLVESVINDFFDHEKKIVKARGVSKKKSEEKAAKRAFHVMNIKSRING